MDRIRALFLAANPDSTTPLHAGREVREIRERLARTPDTGAVELIERWAVRPRDLQQALLDVRPHIVHFSGHGNAEYEIMLEGDDGSPRPVAKGVLADLFRLRGEGVRLVVLSACHSLPQAEAIAEHVDCAIGMRRAIGSEAAAELSAALYHGIASGDSIQRAFESARLHLETMSIPEHRTPQLVVRRDGVDPARIVLARPRQLADPVLWSPVSLASGSPPSSGVTPSSGGPRSAPASNRVQDEPPAPNELHALEEQLHAARRRKETLARVGASAEALAKVDAEILELRRKLRERGQLAVGDTLGGERYVLVDLLGKGGFATVWRAHDEETRTEVAIKVLHPQLVRDQTRRDRFFRGARVMAALRHPGIVRVIEPAGHDRGYDYFVMELLRGGTLREAVVRGRLRAERILDVLSQVGEALGAAHAAGHVHRDVKPANILLDEAQDPKLADFDLVGGGETTGGTRTGGALGTFVYAAPEAMVNAAEADARADVYSLGMTAVFCYHGKDLQPVVMRDVGRVIQRLSCPPEVKAALVRATEWEVDERFESVEAFCQALRAPQSVPMSPAPAAAALPSAWQQAPSPSLRTDARFSPIRLPLPKVRLKPTEEVLSWAEELGKDRFGRYASFSVGGVWQRLRWIPPGRFLMGSPPTEVGRIDNEGPQHQVELSSGFWLADTPCTQILWKAVMGSNPSRFQSPDRPVERVSWEDCQVFLAKLNGRVPGILARLPTEAEWEYACRGRTTTATWRGDLDIRGVNDAPLFDAIAWYSGNSGQGVELNVGERSNDWPEAKSPHILAETRPVGRKQPNPNGLFDMLGNVWEWCQDWYGHYTSGVALDPAGPMTGLGRVCRGGSCGSSARDIRAALRLARAPGTREGYLGFRLACGQRSSRLEGRRPLASSA